MSIAFNNTVYPTGNVGEDDGTPSAGFGIDNQSQNTITINGTVTKVGDTVTATGVLPGGGDTGITSTTNTLTVTQYDNSGQIEFAVQGQGAAAGQPFRIVLSNTSLTPTGSGQYRVTFASDPALQNGTSGNVYQPVCFTTGTLIRVARGGVEADVAVEALAVGDVAVTACGAHRPIHWIGHRTIRHPALAQHPVRIRADAFGPGLPRRDLFLSPGHPVLVGGDADREGGHLVPVMCLINGTTIERMKVASVTYWHVELDSHDILLAEGLPAESYLDWGDRAFFSDAAAHALANPDFVVPGLAGRCRPVAIDGPIVEAERRRLDQHFAAALAAQCGWDEGLALLAS